MYKKIVQEQILWLDGDDFTTRPVETMNKVETFIGVEHYFTKDHFDFTGRKGYPCFKLDTESLSSCMGTGKARQHPELKEERGPSDFSVTPV